VADAGLQADGSRRALKRGEPLYGQTVTHFTLKLFLDDHPVEGRVIVDLAQLFLSDLLVPGARPVRLHTRRPGLTAKLNEGPFSERRWTDAMKKTLAGEYGVLDVAVEDPGRADRTAGLLCIVNPSRATHATVHGRIELSCSLPYLRALVAETAGVDAVLRLGGAAWRAAPGGAAYGYANVALTPSRPMFGQPGWQPPGPGLLTSIAPPAVRPHAIPVAYTGDVDGNLEALFRAGRGIKGAFWANFLAGRHVRLLGADSVLRARLGDARVEPLGDDGLLIVTTASPLPEDCEDNRRRFLDLSRVLEPAFISRAETPETKRALLGYFARP
jgi:hypothetical protein